MKRGKLWENQIRSKSALLELQLQKQILISDTHTLHTHKHTHHSQCAQAGQTEQVQGDQVKFHFVCLFPPPEGPSNTTKNQILELDGLKAGPVLHTLAASDEQDKSSSFLHQAVSVLKAQFLAKFPHPEETAMNVLALVSNAEG
jgi:hypothetical protein